MIFVFGTVWFWIIAVAIILLFIAEAKESGFLATLTLLASCALLQFVGGVNIFQWLKLNTFAFIVGLALYFPVGTVWSFFKWYLLLKDKRQDLIDGREDWERDLTREAFDTAACYRNNPSQIKEAWERRVKHYKPKAADNKGRIMRWIGYWPISAIWTLLDDFVTRIVKSIYNQVAGMFNKMSDKIFEGV